MRRLPAAVPLLVLGTVALAVAATFQHWHAPLTAAFWFWLGACVLGECLWVRLPVGQVTVSMASCFHFATLTLLPREQAMLACLLSGPVVEVLVARKPAIRALFNGGQAALSVGAASWALTAVSGNRPPGDPIATFGLAALATAALCYFVVNSGFVSLAVMLHDRIPLVRAWRANFGTRYELLSNGALFSLGALLASITASVGLPGAVLVMLPFLMAFEGYRSYARARTASDAVQEARAA